MSEETLYTVYLHVRAQRKDLAANYMTDCMEFAHHHDVEVLRADLTRPSQQVVRMIAPSKWEHAFALFIIIVTVILAFLAGLMINPSNANASDEIAIGTILGSKHMINGDGIDYNEDQFPSLYVRKNGWTVGFFRHSYAEWTDGADDYAYIVGYEARWGRRMNGFAGLAFNYPEASDLAHDAQEIPGRSEYIWLGINWNLGPAKLHFVPMTGVVAYGLEHRFSPARTHAQAPQRGAGEGSLTLSQTDNTGASQ